MARTAVTLTTLTAGTFIARAQTNADATNDHSIALGDCPLEELVVIITQTDASARVATIVAGTNPPGNAAGQGNLSQSMAQNEVWVITGLESSRFTTVVSGVAYLYIDLAASFAGKIEAYRVSRAA